MSAVLEGHGLRLRYNGSLALDVPHVVVEEGEVLACIGPNGAGKSTLLRVLGLLERPEEGEVAFRGATVRWDARSLLPVRRRFASVFQEPLLCEGSVEDNVALGLRLRRAPRSAIQNAVRLWLERLGIAGLRARHVRTLSGGEAQRVSLARAFAIGPQVLILDEPFSALDPPTREELLKLLQALLREQGCTTLWVTHDREEALRVGDRVAVVMDGRLEQVGPPAEVFAHPVSEAVARFVGIESILPGRVRADRSGLLEVAVDAGGVVEVVGQAAVGERVLVCLRPEDIVLHAPEDASRDSARNRLRGTIEAATALGALYRVRLRCVVHLVALVTRESFEALDLAPGRPIVASFKATAAHVIAR